MSTAFSAALNLESLSHSNVSNEVKPFARFELNRGNPRDRREVDIVIGHLGSHDLFLVGLNRLAGEAKQRRCAAAKHRIESKEIIQHRTNAVRAACLHNNILPTALMFDFYENRHCTSALLHIIVFVHVVIGVAPELRFELHDYELTIIAAGNPLYYDSPIRLNSRTTIDFPLMKGTGSLVSVIMFISIVSSFSFVQARTTADS